MILSDNRKVLHIKLSQPQVNGELIVSELIILREELYITIIITIVVVGRMYYK